MNIGAKLLKTVNKSNMIHEKIICYDQVEVTPGIQ